MEAHRIVIVGGGAGGLPLATQLGRSLGRRGLAHITLIDRQRRHFWKPHLHEIAAGSMDLDRHAISYMAHAHRHGFHDRIGEMTGLDRQRRVVHLAPHRDEQGRPVTPQREIPYDSLVLAVGSVTHDFGTPGAREHAIALESLDDAERFHRRLVNACIRAQANPDARGAHHLQVVIIGAGATGVELAAELRHTSRDLARYGLQCLDHEQTLGIHLVEAAARVLPGLPERFSAAALARLQALRVEVHTNARVAEVLAHGVQLADGRHIPAELVVWAAGVKGPDFFVQGLDGLSLNRQQQLLLSPELHTLEDPHVFALGDCAACPWLGGPQEWVPPRAQAAHQQAQHLALNLQRRLRGQVLLPWRYRDFGSLVSLGRSSTVGQLMGSLGGGKLWLSGGLAWLMYRGLYQSHQLSLHGPWRAAIEWLDQALTRWNRPRIKLH